MIFPQLPDDARVWIYTAHRSLTEQESHQLVALLTPFLQQWTYHGKPVQGAADVLYHRFLVIGASDPEISGCGIDASTRAVEDAGKALDIQWLSSLTVCYRTPSGTIEAIPRHEFRKRVRNGLITAQTPVFDTSITTLQALRTSFEKPAASSWHARIFRIPASSQIQAP